VIKTVLLIDGGALRVFARFIGKDYTGDFVEDFAFAAIDEEEEHLLRILFYDAPLFEGVVRAPISGDEREFRGGSAFLDNLARRDRFAVRRGSLVFRGWKPRPRPGDTHPRYCFDADEAPTDHDFDPVFEQKGVDMRIGLDIATFAERRTTDRVLIMTTDSDLVAAMKYGRRAGLEIGIVQLPPPMRPLSGPLLDHSDFVRTIRWRPEGASTGNAVR